MIFLDIYVDEMIKNGLTFKDASDLCDEFIEHPGNAAMEGRWADDIAGYPPIMVASVRTAVQAFLEEKGYIN